MPDFSETTPKAKITSDSVCQKVGKGYGNKKEINLPTEMKNSQNRQ